MKDCQKLHQVRPYKFGLTNQLITKQTNNLNMEVEGSRHPIKDLKFVLKEVENIFKRSFLNLNSTTKIIGTKNYKGVNLTSLANGRLENF